MLRSNSKTKKKQRWVSSRHFFTETESKMNFFKTDSITLWLMDITGASMIPDLPNFRKVKPGIISEKSQRNNPLVVKTLLIILKGTIGEKIDGKFRKIYPAVFGFFNVVYWFTYLKGK